MAQQNSPIPSLFKGVENPKEGVGPKLEDNKSNSLEVTNEVDAFYEDLSDLERISEDQASAASESSNPPQKVTHNGDQQVSMICLQDPGRPAERSQTNLSTKIFRRRKMKRRESSETRFPKV